jgi:hypothetical protein
VRGTSGSGSTGTAPVAPRTPPVLIGVPDHAGARRFTARHEELLRELAGARGRGWSALALLACLEHLQVSTVTEAARVSVVDAWVDGPDAFCVVYHPPFDEGRVVGLRRIRSEAVETHTWRLGDMTTWGYPVDLSGPADEPEHLIDPVAFGWNVADFDIGEPLGFVVTILRYDRGDVGWWGTLEAELPEPPP